MIEGMKFHVKGDELKNLLTGRAEWHKNRAASLQVNLKQAEDGMTAASAAAAAAGSVKSPRRLLGGPEALYASAASAPRRSYGGDVEDPVAAIQQAIIFHTNRAVALDFYSKHLIVDATYVLSDAEVHKYELVVEADSIEN